MARKNDDAVYGALVTLGRFASAREVLIELARHHDSPGLSTIYRALKRLCDDGRIDDMRASDGEALYRACGEGHHHHVTCRACGHTVEIDSHDIEATIGIIAREQGFSATRHVIEITGLCAPCASSN
jgi:Fur family ferric uptake transcriptional regulator